MRVCDDKWFANREYLRGRTYTNLNDYLRSEAEGMWMAWDANDLHTLATTWQTGDICKTSAAGSTAQGNLSSVLAGIKPKALIMPSQQDMLLQHC